MSFETSTNNGNNKEERKYHDRTKSDDLQISRTDMNMLIMNYLVTGDVLLCFLNIILKFTLVLTSKTNRCTLLIRIYLII